nr:spore coat protein [Alicyclobacillus acidiphilus]
MMELHELLNFKTICAAKAKAIDGLVTDEQLKALVQQDLQQSLKALDELQTLLGRAQVQ